VIFERIDIKRHKTLLRTIMGDLFKSCASAKPGMDADLYLKGGQEIKVN